jgi:hypothetical protein
LILASPGADQEFRGFRAITGQFMGSDNSDARKKAFTSIYDEHYWGADNLSGAGSSLAATEDAREIVLKVIRDYHIDTVVDVACGDFVWMPLLLDQLKGAVNYTGCDIVESLLAQHREKYPQYSFQSLDFVEGKIPEGDLIICREALQHLPIRDIKNALRNFSDSGAKYLLATTHLRRSGIRNRRDIRPGRCRDRNLMIPPFNLPNPLVIYWEPHEERDKFLALWALPFSRDLT